MHKRQNPSCSRYSQLWCSLFLLMTRIWPTAKLCCYHLHKMFCGYKNTPWVFWRRGREKLKSVKRYTCLSCDPMLYKVSPLCRILIHLQTDSVLIFSLLLSWRLGKQKSIHCGRRSRSLWITRTGPAALPAWQPWARNHGSIIRDQGEVTGSGQEHWQKKVFTVWARKWEKAPPNTRGSWSHL